MHAPLALIRCLPPSPSTERGHRTVFDFWGNFLFFCNGKNVFSYNLINGSVGLLAEHSSSARVVKCSPNGKFVASGDAQGLFILSSFDDDSHQNGQMTAIAKQRLWSGKINDIAWEPCTTNEAGSDSQRIFIVGEGAVIWSLEKKACESWPVSVHSRPVNGVSWSAGEEDEIATCSDDFSIAVFSVGGGKAIGFKHSLNVHSNFVQQIAYSPNGKLLASVSSDKQLVIHGIGQLSIQAHEGGIYALVWCSDSLLLTASADKKLKLWRISPDGAIEMVSEMLFEEPLVGISWSLSQGKGFVLGLSGRLEGILVENGGTISKFSARIADHSSAIVQVQKVEDKILSLDSSGNLLLNFCFHSRLEGTNSIQTASSLQDKLYKLAYGKLWENDKIMRQNVDSFCIFADKLHILGNGKVEILHLTSSSPSDVKQSFACTSNENSLIQVTEKCIITSNDCQLNIFIGNEPKKFELDSNITAFFPSPDGKLLAIGTKKGLVVLYSLETFTPLILHEWSFHCGIVYCLAWRGNDTLYSGSLDGCIVEWKVHSPLKWRVCRGAHAGAVSALAISPSGNELISGGADACIKQWAFDQQ